MKKDSINEMKSKIKNKMVDNKLTKAFDKFKEFIVKEDDYMVFLIMLLVTSFLLEPYGFTRTLPLVLIVPFLLGIFYKGRKRIMLHTVIGMVILASVAKDLSLAAEAIMITTVCTFSGLYLSKYVDHFKKYNLFKKILRGIISFILVVVCMLIYAIRYGNPIEYVNANNCVEKYIEENNLTDYYVGSTFDSLTNTFKVIYVSQEDLKTEIVYRYHVGLKRIVSDEELNISNENDSEEIANE